MSSYGAFTSLSATRARRAFRLRLVDVDATAQAFHGLGQHATELAAAQHAYGPTRQQRLRFAHGSLVLSTLRVCAVRKRCHSRRVFGSLCASSEAANSAALIAPRLANGKAGDRHAARHLRDG